MIILLKQLKRLFVDQRNKFLVEYSSFTLLLTIAAIALLAHVTDAPG
jgi:hypothetical protein